MTKKLHLDQAMMNQLSSSRKLEFDGNAFSTNEFVEVCCDNMSLNCIATDRKTLSLLAPLPHQFKMKPRNTEQHYLLKVLLDDEVKLLTVTGKTGSGKTICTLAAALHLFETKKIDGIVLTKPMSQVGEYELGMLPGGVEEKFSPYLQNYIGNFAQLVKGVPFEQLKRAYNITIEPLQLIRGTSYVNKLVLADEVQVLGSHEVKTLATRIGEGSKLVMMGDLAQIDGDKEASQAGINKIINSRLAKESKLIAHVELKECVRSPLAKLVSDIFDK